MEIKEIFLTSALIKERVTALHITDAHLTLCGEQEPDNHRAHAYNRSQCYRVGQENPAQKNLTGLLGMSDHCDITLLTGDIIDFPSEQNLNVLHELVQDRCYMYCYGNHDWNFPENYADYPFSGLPWAQVCATYDTALARTAQAFADLQSSMDVCIIKGIKFITLNNSGYQFSAVQYERLKQALVDGMPAVVAFHIPLYAPTLLADTMTRWGAPILCATPPELQSEKWDYAPSMETQRCAALIGESKNVLAVLTGHLHMDHEDVLPGGNRQFVTAHAHSGYATVFTFQPE